MAHALRSVLAALVMGDDGLRAWVFVLHHVLPQATTGDASYASVCLVRSLFSRTVTDGDDVGGA